MPEYVCVDGPLSGQLFEWRDVAAEGELLTIGVVDVAQLEAGPDGETEADYRVETPAAPVETSAAPVGTAAPVGARGATATAADRAPGRLRFVAGRGAWRTQSVLVPG